MLAQFFVVLLVFISFTSFAKDDGLDATLSRDVNLIKLQDKNELPGSLKLTLRTYHEKLQIIDGKLLQGTVQSGRLNYKSDFYKSFIGLNIGLYGATKLHSDKNSGNMAYSNGEADSWKKDAWSYIGELSTTMKFLDSEVTIGLQPGRDNPYLPPYDIRSLPPSFRGFTFKSKYFDGLKLEGGHINAMIPRGNDSIVDLSSAYGGVKFDSLSYIGGKFDALGGNASLYYSHFSDMWDQYHFSFKKEAYAQGKKKLTLGTYNYYMHDIGKANSGEVDVLALSANANFLYGSSGFLFGYQNIIGDHFFDYTDETAGVYLTNAMGVDYNAPGENSFQFRYTFYGDKASLPGFKLIAWYVTSHGVDAEKGALQHANADDPLYGRYWRHGKPAKGGRREWGIKPVYTIQEGRFKDLKVAFYVYRNRIDKYYPSSSFNNYQIMIKYPIKIF